MKSNNKSLSKDNKTGGIGARYFCIRDFILSFYFIYFIPSRKKTITCSIKYLRNSIDIFSEYMVIYCLLNLMVYLKLH